MSSLVFLLAKVHRIFSHHNALEHPPKVPFLLLGHPMACISNVGRHLHNIPAFNRRLLIQVAQALLLERLDLKPHPDLTVLAIELD